MLFVVVGTFLLASMLTGAFGRRESGSTLDDVMQITGPLFGIVLVASGVAALVLALRALISHHERSFMVWLAAAFGALTVVFLVAELTLPH